MLLTDLLARAEPINDDGENASLRHTLLITDTDGYAIAYGEFNPRFAAKQVMLAYDSSNGEITYDHLRILVPGGLHGGRTMSDVVTIEVK